MSITLDGTNGVTLPDANSSISSDSGDALLLKVGGTERARIDTSGNVGIGTSSPAQKLDVQAADYVAVRALSTNNSIDTRLQSYSTGNYGYAGTVSNHSFSFITNNAERVRIDTSGNVGIGTSSPSAKLQVVGNVMAGNGTAATPAYHFVGSSAIGMFTPDAGFSIAFSTGSTERMRIDASGNLLFNSGYGSVATAYGCRAWVNFNGTGTVAIQASGNVSSITDNGTGDYTVNFTNAMPDSNYAASAIGWTNAWDRLVCSPPAGTTWNTTAWRIFCSAWTGSAFSAGTDANKLAASFFR